MPVVSRIDWVTRQLDMGRRCHIMMGPARDEGKFKARVLLHPPNEGAIDVAARTGLESALATLRDLVNRFPSVDRGHKCSNGLSEVCI